MLLMTELLLISVFPLPYTLLAFELWLEKAVARAPLVDFSSELMTGSCCSIWRASSLCRNLLCMMTAQIREAATTRGSRYGGNNADAVVGPLGGLPVASCTANTGGSGRKHDQEMITSLFDRLHWAPRRTKCYPDVCHRLQWFHDRKSGPVCIIFVMALAACGTMVKGR